MAYLLLLLVVWKPVYYTFMMVVHSLHPSGTAADDYVGKLLVTVALQQVED